MLGRVQFSSAIPHSPVNKVVGVCFVRVINILGNIVFRGLGGLCCQHCSEGVVGVTRTKHTPTTLGAASLLRCGALCTDSGVRHPCCAAVPYVLTLGIAAMTCT